MYIIYLILSLFGITSPYATNENKHGEAHFQSSTQVASDMLENFHTKAESICLTPGNQSCSGGTVIQDQSNDSSAYGKGIVSVSDGKTQVATFMPRSTSYRFDSENIKGDVYNRINQITGKGINTGYYDQRLNAIVMKDGSTQPLPQGMSSYQIYDHMPVLMTSLKGSQAAISRGAPVGTSDTTVMDNLRKGGVSTTVTQNMVAYPNSFTCANGSSGTAIWNTINCGNSTNNVPSTSNNQVGGTTNSAGTGGNGSGGTPPAADPNNAGADEGDAEVDAQNNKTNQTANLNYSNDGTMKMGTGTDTDTDANDQNDDAVTINSGNNVPIAAGYINNCKNIVYPQADNSKTGLTLLGYSYTYDYYMDVSQCNSFIRPSLDDADNNYAIFPYNASDAAIAKQGWAYKVHDYLYFDWFGSDDEEVGVRNPQSSKWQANSKDCSVSLSVDVYNSSAIDLESMSMQSGLDGTSNTLNSMNCGNQGGENGLNLNDFNDDVQNIFSKVDGNQGPFFNQPFQYWGLTWICYPDSKDIQKNILHYHVTCIPQITFVPQVNSYTDYNIWKNFIGPNNYPLGGLFSVGHKGSNNLGGQWPDTDDRDNSNDDSDDNAPTYGINSDDGDYYGQAIASYYPFAISSSLQDSSTDGVSNVMYNFSSHQGDSYNARRIYYRNNWCSANNPANSPGIVPSGDCRNIMNGILVARNRNFFNFTQSLFQAEAQSMNSTHVGSAASSWDGSVITGTAGYPQQDSDGVWRWHLADLQAPSFATPTGTKIDSSTDVNAIQKGNYFSYSATVPIDGIYGSNVNNVGNVNVPSDINFGNGTSVSPPGSNTQTISTNGYSYSCQLGDYNGYDYSSGQLKYDVNCTLTNIPPSTDNNSNIAKAVKDHGGSMFGYLRVSLLWHNNDDLDLYNTTPKGDLINYTNKMNILELDMNCHSNGCKRDSNDPAENDIWTDKSTIQDGTYQVGVSQANTDGNSPMSTGYGFTTEIVDNNQKTHYFSYNQQMSKGTIIHCFDYTTAGGVITGVTAKDCFESDANGKALSDNNNSANSNHISNEGQPANSNHIYNEGQLNCSNWSSNNDVESLIRSHNVRFGMAVALNEALDATVEIQTDQNGNVLGTKDIFFNSGFDSIVEKNNSVMGTLMRCVWNQKFSISDGDISAKIYGKNNHPLNNITIKNASNYIDYLFPKSIYGVRTRRGRTYITASDGLGGGGFSLPFYNAECDGGFLSTFGPWPDLYGFQQPNCPVGFFSDWQAPSGQKPQPSVLIIFANNTVYVPGTGYWLGDRTIGDFINSYVNSLSQRNIFLVVISPSSSETTLPKEEWVSYADDLASNNTNMIQFNAGPNEIVNGQYIYDSIYNSDKFKKWIASQ